MLLRHVLAAQDAENLSNSLIRHVARLGSDAELWQSEEVVVRFAGAAGSWSYPYSLSL